MASVILSGGAAKLIPVTEGAAWTCSEDLSFLGEVTSKVRASSILASPQP